jgi:hypothetical protein
LKHKAAKHRTALRELLASTDNPDLAAILTKCEEPLVLRCVCCGTVKTVETRCRKRWCPVCARKLAAEKVARYRAVIRRMKSPLFLTLTIRSTTYAAEGICALRKAFKAFRRSVWWKRCEIAGGVCAMEITHGSGGYHPHLHILLDCAWLTVHTKRPQPWMPAAMRKELTEQAQRELTNAWARCIDQDTAIVWVKKASEHTAMEVLKYSVAPAELIAMGDKAAECIRAMTGNRLVVAWGSCYGHVKKWAAEDEGGTVQRGVECCATPSLMPQLAIDRVAERVREAKGTGEAELLRRQRASRTQRVPMATQEQRKAARLEVFKCGRSPAAVRVVDNRPARRKPSK